MDLGVENTIFMCIHMFFRLQVKAVTERMPEAAVNLHGTRCVQKVVEVRATSD